ncbi:asparagine synthase-related protein, partial [Streptomyces sp. NPDC051907]|uniref:asparagine synthase-related protein n=1 Tax=Streptomyces sp. NPDC051907 TaxID=3155284 RepID=UPI003433CCBC
MCGILGHFGADVSPHRVRVAAAQMCDAPLGGGCVRRGPGWALAAGRAATGGGITAAFEGDIDNRLALFTRLEVRGHAVADRDEAAVLRSAFELDGAEFPEHVQGAYAAAVVDARGAPVLVLATDDAGTTPLYYHWDASREQLCFASEIPALLTLLPGRPSLWEPGLDAYLAAGAPLHDRTLIDGVRVLPPGATAVCRRGRGLRVTRRASASGRTAPAPGPAASAEPTCLLGAGGPGADLVTDLRGPARQELPSVGLAAEQGAGQGSGQRAEIDAARLPHLLPDLVWRLGQPDADPAALTAYVLYESAHRAGFRAALATDPVDEIIDGRARVETAVRADPPTASGAGAWLARYVDGLAAVPGKTRTRLYSSDYRAYLADRGDTAQTLAAQLGEEAAGGARRAALTRFELDVLLPARGLRRMAHLSGSHSVCARLPIAPRPAWA